MTEQDMLYLLARIYIRLRLDGVSSYARPLYHELIDVLTAALGKNAEQVTDSDIIDALRPRENKSPGLFVPEHEGDVRPVKPKGKR